MAYVEYEADGKTIKARVWQKVDTLANWEANSLVIGPGEQAFVIDGAGTPINFKIGDGTKRFSELPWWISYDQGQYVQVVGNALPTPTVELGYSFVGPGTYTHAGGDVVAPDGRFSQIVFEGGSWSLKDMGALPTQQADGAVALGDNRAVSGDTTRKLVNSLGYEISPIGVEFISELIGSSLSDTDLWENGGIIHATGEKANGATVLADYARTKKYYEIPANTTFAATLKMNNNTLGYALYDENFVYLSGGGYGTTAFNFSTPEKAKVYIKFTQLKSQSTTGLTIKNTKEFVNQELTKAAMKTDVPVMVTDELDKFGISTSPSGINQFQELIDTDFANTDVWGVGFITSTGAIASTQTDYRYSKKFYRVHDDNEYVTKFLSVNNAKTLVYDKDGFVLRELSSSLLNYVPLAGDYYIRTSVPIASDKTTLRFVNKYPIRSNISELVTAESKLVKSDPKPVNSDALINFVNTMWKEERKVKHEYPIISFVSDDGRIENDWFLDILQEFNYKATFAIVTSWIDESRTNAYNAPKLIEMINNGHEIAGHTHTHPRLLSLSTAQVEEELSKCHLFLRQLDDRVKAPMFISPWGERSGSIDVIVRKYFKGNLILNEANSPARAAALNHYNVPRYSFDQYGPGGESGPLHVSNLEACKTKVDQLVAGGAGWLIFVIHPQYPEFMDPSNTVDRKQDLRLLLQHIKDAGVPVMTAGQAFEYYRNQSIGYKGIDTRYYQRNINGDIEGDLFSL